MRIKVESVYGDLMLSTTVNGVDERMVYLTHDVENAIQDFKMYIENSYQIDITQTDKRAKNKYIAHIGGAGCEWWNADRVIYSDGEEVEMVAFNTLEDTVTLQNELIDDTFTISTEQFISDFQPKRELR